jgi:hypothetical protein
VEAVTSALQEVIRAWPQLANYPELFAAVTADPELPESQIEKLLIAGMAVPRTPESAVGSFIADGEFELADRLLSDPAFTLDRELRADLAAKLNQARRTAQALLESRLLDLKTRAAQARYAAPPPSNLAELAWRRSSDANLALEAWASVVEQAEAESALALRQELSSAATETGGEGESIGGGWKAAIEGAIAARQFDAARFLLNAGPSGADTMEPAAVPRRPPWPWRMPLDEMLAWYGVANAPTGKDPPPEFFSLWSPAPDDAAAHRMLQELAAITLRAVDEESIERFVSALDMFLGAPADAGHAIHQRGDAFVVSLHALQDERCIPLAPFAGGLVALTVADTSHGERPALFLSLATSPEATIDATGLFRLLGDRADRRSNFLRDFGRQLEIATAVTHDSAAISSLPTLPAEVRRIVAWTLDLLDIDHDASVPEVVTHLAGGRATIAFELVRETLRHLRTREEPLTIEYLLRTANSGGMHSLVRESVMKSFEDPLMRAVFGAVALLAGGGEEETSQKDIFDAFEAFWEAKVAQEPVQQALVRLCAEALLQQSDSGFVLSTAIASSVAMQELGDPEVFVAQALRELHHS